MVERIPCVMASRCTLTFQFAPPRGVDAHSIVHKFEAAMDAIVDAELLEVKRREYVLTEEYEQAVGF